jgi:hypothetical protein
MDARGLQRVLMALVTLGALISIAGCSDDTDSNGGRMRDEHALADAKNALEQAGFDPSTDLYVELQDVTEGQDTMVRFVLSGSSDQIDAALATAHWAGEFEPGNTISQTPIPEADTDRWTDVTSSSDTTTVDGRTVFRRCLRGSTDGTSAIHIWAFNT